MYSYELYIGPTIQSRSAARRAVQDLVYQNDYITTFIKGVGPSDCKKYKGEGWLQYYIATLKSDYVIYEPSHTYLQKKKK